jgi:hypothetical protein
MFGSEGFPIVKVSKGWIISIDATSLWAVLGTYQPNVFKTKKEAVEFFDNLCLLKFKEWRTQPAISEHDALLSIQHQLDRREWDSDTLAQVADILRSAGFDVRDNS